MEYNTNRNKITIREYGRNIQKMIDYCITIEDREQRNLTAQAIVKVMTQMNSSAAQTHDYEHKFWDHLHIMSAFNLDIDAPYPPPAKETVSQKPERMGYNNNRMSYPYYGKNIEKIIEAVVEMDDDDQKEAVVLAIANYLKKSYLNWNRDAVNDETIVKHLDKLSDGKLKLEEDATLISTSEALSNPIKQKNIINKKVSNFKYSKKRKRK